MLKERAALNALFMASVALAAFAGASASLSNGFVWDDMLVVTNPVLVDEHSFVGYFFTKGLYYRPFLRLSLALDWSLWRLSPVGYHLNNLIIHAANSVLVFVVAGRLMAKGQDGMLPAFLAALLFALHPVHSESIAWISGRTDLMATLFFLLGFLGFLVYRWQDDVKGIVICAVFYLFSMFSKENGITLIAVVAAYGLLTGMTWRRTALSTVILLAVAALYFILRHGSGLSDVITRPGTHGAYLSAAATSAKSLNLFVYGSAYYIEKLLLPVNLNLLPAIPQGGGYVLIFVAAACGTLYCLIRCGGLNRFLILWIILTMLPSLSILFSQVAAPLGERYLYLSSVGFSILTVTIFEKALKRRALTAILLLISLGYFIAVYERVGQWRSDLTLWGDTVKKSPQSVVAHTNYAIALMQEQDIAGGQRELFTALALPEKSGEQAAIVLNALSTVEISRKRYEKAKSYLMEAVRNDPECTSAYNNLGYVYMQMSGEQGADEPGRAAGLRTAIMYFDKAVSLSPNLSQTKFNLGLCYFELNDLDKAERYFSETVDADPVSKLGERAASLLASVKLRKTAGQYLDQGYSMRKNLKK